MKFFSSVIISESKFAFANGGFWIKFSVRHKVWQRSLETSITCLSHTLAHPVKLVKYLKNVLQWYYPQVEFKLSLSNSFKINYFFNYKDPLPLDLRSGIVYKYTCGICNDSYIGSSVKQARVRFSQHRGFSFRT